MWMIAPSIGKLAQMSMCDVAASELRLPPVAMLPSTQLVVIAVAAPADVTVLITSPAFCVDWWATSCTSASVSPLSATAVIREEPMSLPR